MKPVQLFSREKGFGAIMAIAVLVILASLSAAIVKFANVQQMSSTQDVLSTRAQFVAKAAVEWGLYQALKGGWTSCSNTSQVVDLKASTGFMATVTCNSKEYKEGESAVGVPKTVRLFRIEATACNSATTCPDSAMASSPVYVERKLQVTASNP